MCRTGSVALIAALIAAPFAAGQTGPTLADVPAVERPAEGFFGAVAADRPVEVAWRVEPQLAVAGAPLRLTLEVRNAANPGELHRPDLRADARFTGPFQVEELPDAPATPAGRTFVWTIVPRSEGPTTVPALRYRYYRPAYPPGRRMQTTYARAVPLAVGPAPSPPAEPLRPLPSTFLEAPTRGGVDIGVWAWLVVPAGFGAMWLFQTVLGPARLRRALRELQRAPDAGAVAAAVAPYSASPACAGVLAACDAARYAPGGGGVALPALRAEAARAVRGAESTRREAQGRTSLGLRSRGKTQGRSSLGFPAILALILAGCAPPPADGPGWGELRAGFAVRTDAPRSRPLVRAAADRFAERRDGGDRSAEVAQGRGRALWALGDAAGAVYAFWGGLRDHPGDAGLRRDLEAIRGAIGTPTARLAAAEVARQVAPWSLLVAAAVCGVAVWRGRLRAGVAGWGVLAVVSVQLARADPPPDAVVITPAVLRQGNADLYPPQLPDPLPAGAELTVLGERGGWLRVRAPGGAGGWLPAGAVRRIGRPAAPAAVR